MSKHTQGPWVIKRDMIYGNDGRVSIACVLDIAWPHGLRPDSKANAQRIVKCVNALDGLSDDALDGGWNFKSISKYCKDIESQRDELLEFTEEVRRTGDTRLASMAIAVIAKAKEKL